MDTNNDNNEDASYKEIDPKERMMKDLKTQMWILASRENKTTYLVNNRLKKNIAIKREWLIKIWLEKDWGETEDDLREIIEIKNDDYNERFY